MSTVIIRLFFSGISRYGAYSREALIQGRRLLKLLIGAKRGAKIILDPGFTLGGPM